MYNMFSLISEYFAYPFVRYAVLVGVLTALCASLLGVILVLKRYSFIGDGLSHVAFGALAIASVLKLSNDMIIVIPITVIFAVIILCAKQSRMIKGDASLAMISVGALAIGYLLMNMFPTSSNINGDVCGTLFGSASILALDKSDVIVCGIASVAVLVLFTVFYDKIFAITFDEDFASSIGINVSLFTFLTAIVSAIVIVLVMNLAGSLLTSALVVFPAVSAMRVFKSFKSVIIASATISVISALSGILASIFLSAPLGSCVVIANIVLFFIFTIIGKVVR